MLLITDDVWNAVFRQQCDDAAFDAVASTGGALVAGVVAVESGGWKRYVAGGVGVVLALAAITRIGKYAQCRKQVDAQAQANPLVSPTAPMPAPAPN